MTKRILDVTITLLAAPIVVPVTALVALAVLIGFGRPIMHLSRRAGMGGEVFTLYKFRTMTDERDDDGTLLPDEERMTRLGSRLRASSLDELPSLLNVLKGDMSLVGPRPLNDYYLPRYTKTQARRHEVRPGITGLAQVSGRNSVPWEERLALDVTYVDTRSLRMDLGILARSLGLVVKRTGISADGAATMPEFLGGTEQPEPDDPV